MNATIALQGIVIPGLLSLLFTIYTAFFAIHAVQHVADPADRAGWLLIIVPFTIFGATFYFCTKYQQFKKIGKGGLIRARRDANRAGFLDLSEVERQ